MGSIDSVAITDTIKVLSVNSNPIFTIPTVVNILLVALNLIIGLYLNFFAFNKRKKNDRRYQMQFDLYKALIINNLNKYISHCNKVELEIKMISDSDKIGEDKIDLIQNKYVVIEDTQEEFYRNDLPLIASYSEKMCSDVKSITEAFYDNTTSILGKMNLPAIKDKDIYSEFKNLKSKYISSIFNIIRSNQPDKDTE